MAKLRLTLEDEAVRLDAKRIFLIVSRTLNTKTEEIEKIRRALGAKHVATFGPLPDPDQRRRMVEFIESH
jgi:maleylacetate reductase